MTTPSRPPDHYANGIVQRYVRDLRAGDKVDLDGDPIADAQGTHPEFEFEFEVVSHTVRETDACTLVVFESGFACGFPPDYMIEVDPEQRTDA